MDLGSRDIISSLPNALISHILSFLATKEAASTSVLSKKWRYLFAYVTNLEFDNSVYLHPEVGKQEGYDEPSESFMGFVDRVLALQGNGILNRFSLDCSDYVDEARVADWISNVMGRGVSDLYLRLMFVTFPYKIFVSKTLVRLRLGTTEDLCITRDMKDVFLPKLKTLYIDSLSFMEGGFGLAKLLSGCPVIEELVLTDIAWEFWDFCSVSSTTLKRLTFSREESKDNGVHPESVSFDTPSLVYLEYSDAVAGKYPKVKFDSLVEAHISLGLTEDQLLFADATFSEEDYSSEDDEEKEMACNATDFLMGICNVQILYLSAKTIEVLTICCEPIPVFNNMIQLTIESHSEIGWDSLPSLLKNCPILETLVLKRLDHKYNNGCGNVCCCKRPKHPSCLLTSPVKVLKIFLFDDNDEEAGSEIRQMKHFLEKMPRLEELIVYYNTAYDSALFELSKKLQKIPRIASAKCKIQVISENLSLSSTLPCFLIRNWSALLPEEEEEEEEEEESLFESTPSPEEKYSMYDFTPFSDSEEDM